MFSLDLCFNTSRYKTNSPNNKDIHRPHLKPDITIDINRLKKSNADASDVSPRVMCRQSRRPAGYILVAQVNLTPFAVVSNFKFSTLLGSLESRKYGGGPEKLRSIGPYISTGWGMVTGFPSLSPFTLPIT